MTPEQRRAKIMNLLSQCRVDETERLHSGRATIPAQPIAYYAEKIEELFVDDTPSLFQDVMQASKTFVERFPGGHLTEAGTVTKFGEEAEEFKEAVSDLVIYYDEPRQALIREAFDVMVTMGGVMAYYGIQWPEIEQVMRAGLDKLDKRTTETHTWDEKSQTVMKRSKLEMK